MLRCYNTRERLVIVPISEKKTDYLCSAWFFFIQSFFADRNNNFQHNFLYYIEDFDFMSVDLKRYKI